MAAIDTLLLKLGETAQITKNLDDLNALLEGYKAEKQRFQSLIDATAINRDLLVVESKQALKDLAAAITAAYP